MDVDTSDFAEEEAGTVAYILTLPTIALCVLTVGYMLHIKIIKTSFQEKDITWKLDVTNSCLVLPIYTHSLLTFTIIGDQNIEVLSVLLEMMNSSKKILREIFF